MTELQTIARRAPTIEIIKSGQSDVAEIGQLYRLAANSCLESAQYAIKCGQKLMAKKASMKHGEWLPWLAVNEDILGFKDRAANLMMKAAANPQLTADLNETTATVINRAIWGNNNNIRGTGGTGDNEWYTPTEYIDLVRSVLGTIDLDPASSDLAQGTVKAKAYFTEADDGLDQEWHGRIWLNPPYAQPAIGHFADKMLAELDCGHVDVAIMLTHNYTDTVWFQKLAAIASAICFTRGRV
jgi:DNA N-6-adenine-methyltransferase (Dam)